MFQTRNEEASGESEKPRKDEELTPKGLLGTQSTTPPTQDSVETDDNQLQTTKNTTWYTEETSTEKHDDDIPPLAMPSDE